MMETMAKKNKIRRILKISALVIAGLIGLVLAVILAAWFLFPHKQVLDFVASQTAAGGWPVQIRSASWSPLGKIELQEVDGFFQPDVKSAPIPFFHLKKAAIRFRVLPLLRRELSVSEVILDQPTVSLSADFLKGLEAWAARQPSTKSGPQPLPIELGIQKLTLRDFQFKMRLPDSSTVKEIGIEGLNLDVSKLWIPSQYLKSPEGFRGLIRLSSNEGRVIFTTPVRRYSFDPNINVEMTWGKKGLWNFKAKTDFRQEGDPKVSVIGVRMEAEGTGFTRKIQLKKSEIQVGGQTVAVIEGESNLSGKNPKFRFQITDVPVSLEMLKSVLIPFLPDSIRRVIEPVNLKGRLELVSGWISGDLERYNFNFSSGLRDAWVEYPNPNVRLEQGEAFLTTRGTGSIRGIQSMQMTGNLTLPQIRGQINDTVSIHADRTYLSWILKFNEAMMPVSGVLTGAIQNILGGQCSLKADWGMTASGPARIDTLWGSSAIRVTSMDLAALPNSTPGIKGKVTVAADLKIQGEKNIRFNIAAEASTVSYPFQGRMETLPTLRADASMFWHAERAFQKWILDRTDIRAMDLFSAGLTGEAVPKNQEYSFHLQNGRIQNASITQYLPQKLRNDLEGIELSGHETVEMAVKSKKQRNSTAFSLAGNMRFEDGGVSLPLQAVRVEGVRGEIDLEGTQERISGRGTIKAGGIYFQKIRPDPFTRCGIDFAWSFVPPSRLEIRNGMLAIPDLAAKGLFSADFENRIPYPMLKSRADFTIETADSLRLTPMMVMSGKARGWVTLESPHSQSPILRLKGEVTADSMDVFSKPIVEVRRLQGGIPFVLDFDPANPGFTGGARASIFPDLSYENDRNIYKNLFPQLSEVNIRSVRIAGYPIDDIRFDVGIRDGWVQVPRFQARLLGGNLGGALRLELNDGRPASMRYWIKADAARINSAVLLKSEIPDEDTELDATMNFQGRGLDPNAGIDVEGALHITKIGPKFAGTMLRGIDPQGVDRSIRLTRRLFDLWYKPKIFSFELRHGYVYPALSLSQPWFSPLRIPEKVEYGRLPIEFFIKNSINLVKK
jgi:hypothetical protein